MISSITYRTLLSLAGSTIMTVGAFGLLQGTLEKSAAAASARVNRPPLQALHSATMDPWQVASDRQEKPEA